MSALPPGVVSGIAEHDADLFAKLVDEDDRGLGLGDCAGQLAQRLRHEPGLHADVGVSHVALDLRAGNQRRHRVHDDDIDGAGPDQGLADLHGLLAGVRLGDVQLVDIDPDVPGVGGVQYVLHVDVGCRAAQGLGLSDNVLRQGGLAR